MNQYSSKLVYEDNGAGVTLENKSQLFKERVTTIGSTGFGLFLIKKMMDVYDWNILSIVNISACDLVVIGL